MAQKTEKEEAEIKTVSETLKPCIINISLASTYTANNKVSLNCFPSSSVSEPRDCGSEARTDSETKQESVVQRKRAEEPRTNRCSGCRRNVGLTGFRCRCGDLFCSEHRYSDRHSCSYDYKVAGKAAIARENPVVKAPKIVKI